MNIERVYVAGKLNADAVGYIHNCHKMMNTAELLREAGYAVYVPCLDNQMGWMFGWEKYECYFNFSQPWLKVSDAVYLVPGWETSQGTIKEIETAWEYHIPVFDTIYEMWEYTEDLIGGEIVEFKRGEDNSVIGGIKRRSVKEQLYDAGRA
jgi:hypothetical protein